MATQQERIEKMKQEMLQSLNNNINNNNSANGTFSNRNTNANRSVLDVSVGDLVNLVNPSSSALPVSSLPNRPSSSSYSSVTTYNHQPSPFPSNNENYTNTDSSSSFTLSNVYGQQQGRYLSMHPSENSVLYNDTSNGPPNPHPFPPVSSFSSSTVLPPVRNFRNILSETPNVNTNTASHLFPSTVNNLNLSNVSSTSSSTVGGTSSSSTPALPTSAAMAVERAMRSHATMSVNADVNKLKADVSTALLQLDEQKQTFLSVVGDLEVQLASIQRERTEALSSAETERQRAERAIQVSSRMQATVEAMTQSLAQARDAHTTLQNQQESLLRTLGLCQTERDNAKRETANALTKIEDYKKALEQAKGREALAVATEASLKQQLGSIAKDVQLSKQEGMTILADEKARHQLEIDNLKRELDNSRADNSRLQNKVTSQQQSLEQLSALWEKTLYELQTSRDNETNIRKELEEMKRITEGERVAGAIARDECVVLRDTIETLKQEILSMRKQFSIHVQAASDRMLATKAVQNVLQNSSLNASIAYTEAYSNNNNYNNTSTIFSASVLSPRKPTETSMVSPTSYSTVNYSTTNGNNNTGSTNRANLVPSMNPSRLTETAQADLQRAIANTTVLENAWNVLNTTKIVNNNTDVVFSATRHSPPQNPSISVTSGVTRPVRPRSQASSYEPNIGTMNMYTNNAANTKPVSTTASSVSLNLPDLDGDTNDGLPWNNGTIKPGFFNGAMMATTGNATTVQNPITAGENSWITLRPSSVTTVTVPLEGSLAGITASSSASAKVATLTTTVHPSVPSSTSTSSNLSPSTVTALQNRAKYRIDQSVFPESPVHKQGSAIVVNGSNGLRTIPTLHTGVMEPFGTNSNPNNIALSKDTEALPSTTSTALTKTNTNVQEDEIVNPFLVTLAQAEPLTQALISGARTAWWTLTAEDGTSFDEGDRSTNTNSVSDSNGSGSINKNDNIQRINIDFGIDSNSNTVVTSDLSANPSVTNVHSSTGSTPSTSSSHVTPQLLNYLNHLTPPTSTTPTNGANS